MKILQVAYPFQPVSPASAGGTEQIVAALDAELTRAGHESVVLARAGSKVTGRLVVGAPCDADFERSCRMHGDALDAFLARERVDVIHDQGAGLQFTARTLPAPLLTTIHLARGLYQRSPLVAAPGRHYNLVSTSQRREYGGAADALQVVPNGIALDRFIAAPAAQRAELVLAMGRICPEKGWHLAIAAAARAGAPLIIAGQVYDFPSHRAYFDEHVAPHLGSRVRFVDTPDVATKCALLAAAGCVLIASQVAETSSLVAMEAAASGTPVVCFRAGALPEIVEDGVTGWIVDDVDAMADAIGRASTIYGAVCRAGAEARFSAAVMARRYLDLYAELAPPARSAAPSRRASGACTTARP
jgi:glycosyltransferase involved in cell wall biosynthesis